VLTNSLGFKLKLKLIYDQQSVGHSVLVSNAHLGPVTNFSFSLKFPLDSCDFVNLVRPLWREGGSVIYLYNCFWTLPEQSLLGRSSAELTAIFYCLIWDSLNLEVQVPVFISPRNRVARLYPRALCSLFCRLLRLAATTVNSGEVKRSEVNLRPTVSRPVCLGVRRLSGPATNFSLSSKFLLDSCGFIIL
jgi:hypothetical protein